MGEAAASLSKKPGAKADDEPPPPPRRESFGTPLDTLKKGDGERSPPAPPANCFSIGDDEDELDYAGEGDEPATPAPAPAAPTPLTPAEMETMALAQHRIAGLTKGQEVLFDASHLPDTVLFMRGGRAAPRLRNDDALRGISTSRPRRRRDPSPRNIHVTAVSADYPRRSRGVAATQSPRKSRRVPPGRVAGRPHPAAPAAASRVVPTRAPRRSPR